MNHNQLLDQQISELLHAAPQDPATASAVHLVATVLKTIAQQLNHAYFFLVTDSASNWLLTTLSNRHAPDIEKNVIYAYADYTAANVDRLEMNSPDLDCQEYGVLEILLRVLNMREVDSVIFFEGMNSQSGIEVERRDLEKLCEKQISRARFSHQQLKGIYQRQRNSQSKGQSKSQNQSTQPHRNDIYLA
jgi:hypothetical protein